jgi:serine/threonine-protein kinase
MNAEERSRRALSLFDELIELDDDARTAALTRLGTEDAELQREVMALLEADAAEGLLEHAPISLLSGMQTSVAPSDALPERIGPWRITGEAGRGGMGAVYLGERDDGQFQQRAAIKLIRMGMDTPTLRARFLRERQILAALKHPHIATLLDGGVTETMAPYFAMERVEGSPIDAWCDGQQASLRERVQLFLQVCEAVQHAHQSLVVHRDLKPSNVLVDEEGQAKLLDFGIAKLLAPEAGASTTQEQPHTPKYAAPEQLSGGAITTAADIYTLGLLLHLLLCGTLPRFEAGEPEPLVRAAMRASDAQVRARRLASPKALAREVGSDLGAIVLHCLSHDAAARYPSVSALAADLHAWLDGVPVTAQERTARYVLSKFVRRNRGSVAAATLVLVAVGAGVGGVLWQANKARQAAQVSQAQLHYLSSLLEVLAPSTAEARELDRSRLVAAAAEKARQELADEPASLASVELALAEVAQGVGDAAQAAALADSAQARRAKLFGPGALATAEAEVRAAAARFATKPPDLDGALQRLGEAITNVRARDPGSALLVNALQKRAAIFGEKDAIADSSRDLAEAAALCEGKLAGDKVCEAVWMEQGSLASRERLPAKALPFLRRAYEARRKRLGEEHADTLELAAMLAWAQAEQGDLDGGLALAEKVYAADQRIFTQPTQQSLAASISLARLLRRVGQTERAEQLLDQYLKDARALLGEKHPDTILGYSDRASLLLGLGRYTEAAQQFEVVARTYEEVGNPVNAAMVQGFAASAWRDAGKPEVAIATQPQALEKLRSLYPAGGHVQLARALGELAQTESALGRYSEALAHFDACIAMHRKLQPQGAPNAPNARAFRGETLFKMGRTVDAESELRAAEAELQTYKAGSPNFYWEPFAMLTRVACHNGAADCEALRTQARVGRKLTLPARTQQRLDEALSPSGL